MVSLDRRIRTADGYYTLTPYNWQFVTAVGQGNNMPTGYFVDSGQALSPGDFVAQIALGDLDGDGDLDAFLGKSGSNFSAPNAVWLNEGNGVFTDTGQTLGNRSSFGVALGDVDGDGDLDAVIANYRLDFLNGGRNRVWLNDGNGYFTDSWQTLGTEISYAVQLGDVDGDGDLDAYFGNIGPNRIWLNDGHGTFVNSGQALANEDTHDLALGDLDGDGDLDAFTANSYAGGVVGPPDRVWLNDGSGTYSDSSQRLGTFSSQSVALGDLDGDGDLDAYVGTSGFNVVSDRVWLNDGTGQFIESEVGVFDDTQSVTLGDVDGDGDLDVFLGNGEEDRLLLNNGDGLFGDGGQQFEFAWTTSNALADIDNDADLDLFVADSDADVVNIWFNEFQQPLIDLLVTNDSPVELGNAIYFTSTINSGTNPVYNWDFGDGLSSNSSGPNVSHIYDAVGIYTAVLTVHNTISVLTATTNVTVTDIPIRGLTATNSSPTIPGNTTFLTAALSSGSNTYFSWQFGDGIAGIGTNVTHTYSAGVYTAVVTAANSVSSLTATTRILVGYPLTVTATSPQGNGSRLLPGVPLSATLNRSYNVNTVNPQSFTVWGKQTGYYTSTFSLFDNTILFDTLPDFKPGEEIFVHLNKKLEATDSIPLTPHVWQFWAPVGEETGGGGTLSDSGQELGTARSQDIALGDVDLDGDLDVFVANGDSRTRLWLNAGNGSFSDSGQLLENRLNMAVELGDLDGDGDLDAFVGNSSHEPNTIWLNQGGDQGGALGQYLDSGQLLGELGSYDVALGDLDSDGDLDAFVANIPLWDGSTTNGGFNKIWLNDGNGQFYDGGLDSDDRPSYGVALGDLDNDGDLDAFIANRKEPNQVWLNDGTGVFSDTGQLLGNSGSYDVALGDLDNDGDLDAFIANYDNTGVSGSYQPNKVWFNDGSGTFVDSGQTLGANASFSVALGDLDGDGDLDAIVVNNTYTYYPQNNKIWWNDGAGIYNIGQNMGQRTTCDVAIGDLDSDNDLDAYLANCSANYVSQRANQVWLNDDAPVAVSNLTVIHDAPTVIGSATHFTATAFGTNIEYLWSLGDGTLVTGETITHTYANEGTYLVVVTATNVLNSITVTEEIFISQPVTGLVAANSSPTILGDIIWFNASVASGENVSYTWDLGDGTVANGAEITHTYVTTGMFTAIVTATNFVNQLITTSPVTIINEPDIPIEGVTVVNNSPAFLGQATYFTATILSGTNAIYNWGFGDGASSIGPIVAHIYTDTGTFTATVTVANGSNTVSVTTVIHVILPDNNYSVFLPLALKPD